MTDAEPPLEQGPGALTQVLRQLAQTWWITVSTTVVGLIAGVVLAMLVPSNYTAEVRLGVGGQTLSAQAVPGFVFASQELAATYARYVDDAASGGRLADELGVEAASSVTDISASPIPSSSVLIVEVDATDASIAEQAAQSVAQALVAQIDQAPEDGGAADALAEFGELSAEIAQLGIELQNLRSTLAVQTAQLEASPDSPQLVAAVDGTRAAIASAETRLSVLELRQQAASERYRDLSQVDVATLSVVREAEVVDNDAVTRVLVWGTFGALLGLAVAWALGTVVTRRRNSRAEVMTWA